jgi:hypothetical protein
MGGWLGKTHCGRVPQHALKYDIVLNRADPRRI